MRNFLNISLLLTLFIASCASVKNKPQTESSFGHNFTSKYNILFHAKQIINEVEKNSQSTVQLDYDAFLTVHLEPEANFLFQNTQLMDSAITKAFRVINEKNKGKYINEAYYLIAKANFLKGNFYNASEYAHYLRTQYADYPHYKQTGLLLEAKALLALDRDNEAADVLDSLFAGLESDKKTQALAFATQADYYIKIKDLESAALMLEQALDKKSKKSDKNRWKYLLGQIYLELDDYENALKAFKDLSKRNPNFNMSFRANLEKIRLESLLHEDVNNSLIALKKLLRDDKNKEFLDQVHYVLAEQYLKNGEVDHALEHIEKSLEKSTNNRLQKSKSYILLGDHYFSQNDYPQALIQYNQAASNIPLNSYSTKDLQKKVLNYQQLTENFLEINKLSSYNAIFELEGEQREAEINRIAELEYALLNSQAEKDKKNSRSNFTGSSSYTNPFELGDRQNSSVNVDGRFYFNNPEALGLGASAFKARWGNRPLVDNWRYSSDISLNINTEANSNTEKDNTLKNETQTLENYESFYSSFKTQLLEQIPQNSDDFLAASKKIKDLKENNGEIYRYNVEAPGQSILIFEQLINDFPEDSSVPRWAYQIYQMSEENATGEKYKALILEKYSESVFAQIIKDPDYFKYAQNNRKNLIESFNSIYSLFESRDYSNVRSAVEDLIRNSTPTLREENVSIFAQLAYLRTLAIGYEENIESFNNALVNITEQYQGDKLILPLVQQQLSYIEENYDEFSLRESALVYIEENLETQGNKGKTGLLPWPELVMTSVKVPASTPLPRNDLNISAGNQQIQSNQNIGQNQTILKNQQLTQEVIQFQVQEGPLVDRDLTLFPEEAKYYFVINIMHPTVNLSPSRLGIGQFNRSRYAHLSISHQLKVVNRENQLVFIGSFNSFTEAKQYESQISELLKDIMKIPEEYYNSFIVTEALFNGFKDAEEIYQYHDLYSRQK